MVETINKLIRVSRQLLQEKGREPQPEEIAKEMNMPNEQNHFIGFFRIKGLDEIVPLLLSDFYSDKTTNLTRWLISDCIYQIKSKQFIEEYLNIASNRAFGINRQMIILLLLRFLLHNLQ